MLRLFWDAAHSGHGCQIDSNALDMLAEGRLFDEVERGNIEVVGDDPIRHALCARARILT